MALFSPKKNTKKEAPVVKAVKVVATDAPVSNRVNTVLKQPRITEKASMKTESNVYTFEIAKSATKDTVKKAVIEMYKVTPVKIRVAAIPGKTVFVRGRKGFQSSGKKAYVFLKKGDKIEFV